MIDKVILCRKYMNEIISKLPTNPHLNNPSDSTLRAIHHKIQNTIELYNKTNEKANAHPQKLTHFLAYLVFYGK